MPKTKSITDAAKRDVTHDELRALTAHISALIAAHDVRITECERVLAVDPSIGESAADFLKRIRGEAPEIVRTLALVPDSPEPA